MEQSKSNFDELLERYARNQTTPEEKAKIEAWLDVVKTENFQEENLTRAEQDRLFETITGNLGLEEFQHTLPGKNERSWAMGIAASLILFASIGALLWFFNQKTAYEKLILTDGTIVWLKGKDSKLAYYERPNDSTRYATLVGEGLFEVAKNPDRPFVISCGDMNVRVLGTSFNLKFVDNNIDLDVLTGKVKLTSANDSEGIEVIANESVSYSTKGKIAENSLTKNEVKEITQRTEYDMLFANVAISDIFSRMEKKFDISIIGDEAFMDCTVTGDFTDHSLDNTLKMLSDIIDMRYVIENNTVTVSGKGCN